MIDFAKSDPAALTQQPGQMISSEDTYFDHHPCAQGQNGAQLTQAINSRTNFVSLNTSRYHFVIMDEVDNLTEAAQAGFKAIMNKPHVVFIMTTNNLDQIDAGIQNRSVLIDMNLPPPVHWRPILRRVYTNANLIPPSDAALDQVVIAGRGSARSIFTDVVMGANQAKRAGQTAVSKISNLRS